MQSRVRSFLACLSALAGLALPNASFAWGELGHETTGAIAWSLMSPAARTEADRLLRVAHNDPKLRLSKATLADAAAWADYRARLTEPRSKAWHFVNVPVTQPGGYQPANCAAQRYDNQPRPNECVIARIEAFRTILASPGDDVARARALLFLVHFLGDIHQPLHCGDRGDSGGNGVMVQVPGHAATTLHSYWDKDSIANIRQNGQPLHDPEALGRFLMAGVPESDIASWRAGDAVRWCNESVDLARASGFPAGTAPTRRITRSFANKTQSIAMERVRMAGVRIAWTLDTVLTPH